MFWDSRYGAESYVYGTEPNEYLKETWTQALSKKLPAGSKCLMLGEGEGRNGVYMAEQELEVTGVDLSKVGLEKAEKLAKERGVQIQTVQADLNEYDLGTEKWDLIVSIHNHLPPPIRARVLEVVPQALKPGGYFVLEGYIPKQLEYKTGGPPDAAMMYSQQILQEAMDGKLDIEKNEELVRNVTEGDFHSGEGAVVQFLGRKPGGA